MQINMSETESLSVNQIREMEIFVHGDFGPSGAIALRLAKAALDSLGLDREKIHNLWTIFVISEIPHEDFLDTLQILTGCTIGNDRLIIKDYRKYALTIMRADTKEAVRVRVKPSAFKSDIKPVFEKLLKLRRQIAETISGKESLKTEFYKIKGELAGKILKMPRDQLVEVNRVKLFEFPKVGPSCDFLNYEQVECAVCGESVYDLKARLKDGKIVCISCSGEDAYYQLSSKHVSA